MYTKIEKLLTIQSKKLQCRSELEHEIVSEKQEENQEQPGEEEN